MQADVKGALARLNTIYVCFEHKGESMTKQQVKEVLEYALKKGYKSTSELKEEEIENILNKQ